MKKLTTLVFAALLGILSLTPMFGKSWSFSLSTPAAVGTTQLEAGKYSIKMDGNTAILTLERNNKSVKVPAKATQASTKFHATRVNTKASGSAVQLSSIDLGGSTTSLEFAD